ncbi:MAG: N-acyl-D-amino-acid deacylase family protein [Alphaproteobacteria bacterium]
MHDLLIKGGTVIDGTAADRFTADIAIDNGQIADIGKLNGPAAKRTIDADGLLVTPGWVDIHTHFDGQVTWDEVLRPSFDNGVTSVVMGNCGVGFAPRETGKERWLIGLMEGVEEIPGTALHDGIRWSWTHYSEYLDYLDNMPHALDVGGLVAHGALRAYVMKDRAELEEPASEDEARQMAALVRDAMAAGAFGFSTSRTGFHRSVDGFLVPGTFADVNELSIMANEVTKAGHGLMQVVPFGVAGEEEAGPMRELDMLAQVARGTGCPIQFTMGQVTDYPGVWRDQIAALERYHAEGLDIRPQVFGRGTGVLFSFQATNPFHRHPTYLAELAHLPHEDRVRKLHDPDIKAKLLAEQDSVDDAWKVLADNPWPWTYRMGYPMNFEPDPSESVEAIAKRQGRDPKEVGYDLLLEDDGRAFLTFPLLGYAGYDLEDIREMLLHPLGVMAGSDAGAHCNTILDAATPTFMLTHWTRDRTRGPKLPLEWVVQKQTQGTAQAFGMTDRGVLRPGFKADINVIDYDRLQLLLPEYVHDLPSGAGRLIQQAEGYVATINAGQVINQNGEDTGARPGKVIRSRPMPAAMAAE